MVRCKLQDFFTRALLGANADFLISLFRGWKWEENCGEEAILILRDGPGNGSSVIESVTGALPLEFSSILPTDGEYELVVEQ